MKNMFVIGISGGSGSGKSTFVKKISEGFRRSAVGMMSMDSYYRDNSHIAEAERQELNFDHPSAIDFILLEDHIQGLKRGEPVDQPVYSFITCTRTGDKIRTEPARVFILEGILVLHSESLRKFMDLKIFIDTDPHTRLKRILSRDIHERGRDRKQVLERYKKILIPMHDMYVGPSGQYADIIIPGGGTDFTSINLIRTIIKQKLQIL
jgi:uridine kinase